MIDRSKRDVAADLISDFCAGKISDGELDDNFPRRSADPALWEVYLYMADYYDVMKDCFFEASDRAPTEVLALRRCVLFLRSDLEYRWAAPSLGFTVLSVLSLGIAGSARRQLMHASGCWPFKTQAEYETAAAAAS